MDKKELVVKYQRLVRGACSAHNLQNVFYKKIKGSGNQINAPCALLKKVHIHIKGNNNTITIGDFSQLKGVSIVIHGNNNCVSISPWCTMIGTELCMEDSENTIYIGEHSRFLGRTHLATIEGTKISVGGDCLFSGDGHFRTGDSHSVLNLKGERINPSEDISIGDHVWVGAKVTCLKGAVVPSHSVVGACALITGKFSEPNCALAGVPAKVVKREIDWSITRIPMDNAKGEAEG